MKKMLYYILSSFFLLTILNSCESSDDTADTGPVVTFADLAGTFTGDSDVDFNFLLTPALAVNSAKANDGASVEFKDTGTNNLVITLADVQLSTASGTAVNVGVVFTFSIDGLLRKDDEEDGEIVYAIGEDGGTVAITAGSVEPITVGLTDVVASIETQSGVSLTADATIPKAVATSLIKAFDDTQGTVSEDVEVEITLVVSNITDRKPNPMPPPTNTETPMPTLANLAGMFTGDSDLDLERCDYTCGPRTSPSAKETDGAAVEFKDQAADNLVITVTDAQLSIPIPSLLPVDVDGVFTFTVDNLTQANATADIAFEVGKTGSIDLTVGAGSTITGLALKEVAVVTGTTATESEVTLTATANLTVPQTTALVRAFNPLEDEVTSATNVEFTLAVSNITDRTATEVTLADLQGRHKGESELNIVYDFDPTDIDVGQNPEADGAAIVFSSGSTNNLVITLTDTELTALGIPNAPQDVPVDAVFTFTASAIANRTNSNIFDIGDTGSVALTVGAATTTATTLALTEVNATATRAGLIVLTAKASIAAGADATAVISPFDHQASPTVTLPATGNIPATIELIVNRIQPTP